MKVCAGYTEQYSILHKDLIHEFETYLVGPRATYEILGMGIRPMQLYLTDKLVPLGSTSDVVNERDNAIETHVQISEEEINEQLTIRKMFRQSTDDYVKQAKKRNTIKQED